MRAYGNFTGGLSKGASYNGATQFGLSVDTDKAFGLKGGTFFVDALQIHGHGITAARLNALQVVSGVEAEATTRLWELWYQQALGDKFDVRAFHDTVLDSGALPLDVLSDQVDAWITRTKSASM